MTISEEIGDISQDIEFIVKCIRDKEELENAKYLLLKKAKRLEEISIRMIKSSIYGLRE
jgi:hypothetical protein